MNTFKNKYDRVLFYRKLQLIGSGLFIAFGIINNIGVFFIDSLFGRIGIITLLFIGFLTSYISSINIRIYMTLAYVNAFISSLFPLYIAKINNLEFNTVIVACITSFVISTVLRNKYLVLIHSILIVLISFIGFKEALKSEVSLVVFRFLIFTIALISYYVEEQRISNETELNKNRLFMTHLFEDSSIAFAIALSKSKEIINENEMFHNLKCFLNKKKNINECLKLNNDEVKEISTLLKKREEASLKKTYTSQNNLLHAIINFKEIKINKEIYLLIKIEDITQLKQSYDKEIETTKKIERVISEKEIIEKTGELKDAFLANMSHEMRTPMNSVLGMSYLLGDTKLNKDQQKYVDSILTSGTILLKLINNTLDFSKFEFEGVKLENIEFNIIEHIKSIINNKKEQALNKNINLSFEYDNNLSGVNTIGDPLKLKQVLVNLLDNALKFTHKGSISVICKIQKESIDSITIVFKVLDTGIGIPASKQKGMFERFSQADISTTRKYGGTGLGLSICKQIIESYKSTIVIKSEEGKGSCFSFVIQFKKGSPSIEGKEKEKSKVNDSIISKHLRTKEAQKNIKVLLVEDNEINILLTVALLERKEMNVDVAENGKIALEKIGINQYDIILMDIQMPIMGGVETAKKIRQNKSQTIARTPIIALTANAMKDDKKFFLSEGKMNAYISKPFNPADLYQKIFCLTN